MTIEELTAELAGVKTELAGAKSRITELNQESAGHRLNAKTEREAREAAVAKHADDLKASTEKLTAAETAATEAGARVNNTLRDAALRLAAKDAGMIDLDALKLLDTSAVKVGEDGAVSIPDKFFEKAKEAKAYLFSQTGAQTGNTSSTSTPPKAADNTPKSATKMTNEEYAAAKAAAISGR